MIAPLFRALFVFVALSSILPAWADQEEDRQRRWHDARGLPEDALDKLEAIGMRGIDQRFIDHVAPHQSISKCNPASNFTPDFLPSPAWDAWNVSPEELHGFSDLTKTDAGEMFHPFVPWELGLQAYCEVIFNVDDVGVPIRTEMAARCTLAPYVSEALAGVLTMRFEPASAQNSDNARNRMIQPIEFCHKAPAFS